MSHSIKKDLFEQLSAPGASKFSLFRNQNLALDPTKRTKMKARSSTGSTIMAKQSTSGDEKRVPSDHPVYYVYTL